MNGIYADKFGDTLYIKNTFYEFQLNYERYQNNFKGQIIYFGDTIQLNEVLNMNLLRLKYNTDYKKDPNIIQKLKFENEIAEKLRYRYKDLIKLHYIKGKFYVLNKKIENENNSSVSEIDQCEVLFKRLE